MEPNDAVDRLRTVLRVLGAFKAQYYSYKAASEAESPSSPWRFQTGAIFGRLDAFMERCSHMLQQQATCLQVCVAMPSHSNQNNGQCMCIVCTSLQCAAHQAVCAYTRPNLHSLVVWSALRLAAQRARC